MRYFAKTGNPNVLPPGLDNVTFQRLIPGAIHLVTDDPVVLAAIDKVLGKVGGIFELTEAQWHETLELQKKMTGQTQTQTNDPRNALPQLRPSLANFERAVAAGIDPLTTPRPTPTPPPAPEPEIPVSIESGPTVRKNPLLRKTA